MPSAFERLPSYDAETELGFELHTLEREYLFSETTPEYIKDKTERLRSQYPNQPHARIDFFEASKAYETANEMHERYLKYIFERRDSSKPISKMTQEEFYAIGETFPELIELHQLENQAFHYYQQSGKGYWKGEYIESTDAKAYALDVQVEHAQRARGAEMRRSTLDEVRASMLKDVIPNVENKGKKFEYIFTVLVRDLIREAGAEHLVNIQHGLPIEDVAHGVDLVLTFGDSAYDIQLKALADDGYRDEYNSELLKKSERKLDENIKLLKIDPGMLDDCYKAMREEKPSMGQKRKLTTSGKQIIATLASFMGPDEAQFLEVFEGSKSAVKETEGGKKLTDKFISANRPPALLIALGFLKEEDRANVPAILEAKKKMDPLIPEIKKAFRTETAYLQLDSTALKEFEQKRG